MGTLLGELLLFAFIDFLLFWWIPPVIPWALGFEIVVIILSWFFGSGAVIMVCNILFFAVIAYIIYHLVHVYKNEPMTSGQQLARMIRDAIIGWVIALGWVISGAADGEFENHHPILPLKLIGKVAIYLEDRHISKSVQIGGLFLIVLGCSFLIMLAEKAIMGKGMHNNVQ